MGTRVAPQPVGAPGWGQKPKDFLCSSFNGVKVKDSFLEGEGGPNTGLWTSRAEKGAELSSAPTDFTSHLKSFPSHSGLLLNPVQTLLSTTLMPVGQWWEERGCSNPTGRSQWDAEKWGVSHPRDRGYFVLFSTSKSL